MTTPSLFSLSAITKWGKLKVWQRWSGVEWALAIIMLAAIFLRVWNLPDSVQFLGDQGRDALVVSKIFRDFDPVFIGPVTSVGNMYLGPGYYYFMAPFLWLTFPNPIGPVYAVALLGGLAVWLTYRWGKELVGQQAAMVAAGLFAISHIALEFSRFSWNPNPAPLASLVMIYFTYRAWRHHPKYWLVVAVAFSVLIQLHYMTLLSLAGAGLIWLWQGIAIISARRPLKPLVLATLGSIAIVLLSTIPLVLFDLKHDFLNARAFGDILFGGGTLGNQQATGLAEIWRVLRETHGRGMHILFEITVGQFRRLNTLMLAVTLGGMAWLLKHKAKHSDGRYHGLVVISAYLLTGIGGTAAYQHTIFNHYIAYLFPITFIILGVVLVALWKWHWLTKAAAVAWVGFFVIFNVSRWPIQDAGWKISDIQRTADGIYQRVEPGEKYNLVLLSGTGDIDAQNYRYFLEATDRPPVGTEQRGQVETLFIINEDRKLDRVVESPIYEIVVFPDKTPQEVYNVPGGPAITVLSTR